MFPSLKTDPFLSFFSHVLLDLQGSKEMKGGGSLKATSGSSGRLRRSIRNRSIIIRRATQASVILLSSFGQSYCVIRVKFFFE